MSDELSRQIARMLLEIGAARFQPDQPVTFRSGIRSPVYVDNRRIPYYPQAWRIVIEGFINLVTRQDIKTDVIAGIEVGGIPHSSVLAFQLQVPSVFVRKQEKMHGLGNRVEGGDVSGRRVLLVEDMITTGGSSLSGLAALREAGAVVEDCIAIISYGLPEAVEAFRAAGARLTTLTTFGAVLAEAEAQQLIDARVASLVSDWLRDPRGWAERSTLK